MNSLEQNKARYFIKLHSEEDGMTKIVITHYEMNNKILKLFNEDKLVFVGVNNNGKPALFFNRGDSKWITSRL